MAAVAPFDQPQFQVPCYCGAQPGEPCIGGVCSVPDCQSEMCQWLKGQYAVGAMWHSGGARQIAKMQAELEARDRDAQARGWPSAAAECAAEARARGWEQ